MIGFHSGVHSHMLYGIFTYIRLGHQMMVNGEHSMHNCGAAGRCGTAEKVSTMDKMGRH